MRHYLLRFFICAAAFVAAATVEHATGQEPSQITGTIQTFLKGYKTWPPLNTGERDPFDMSIYNYAIRATVIPDADEKTAPNMISTARDWAFSRSELELRRLAASYKIDLESLFARLYYAKGLRVVTARPFTSSTQHLYLSWYDCVAKSASLKESFAGQFGVLSYINYNFDEEGLTAKAECRRQFLALATEYGVPHLTADQLTVVGFFSRREKAHAESGQYLSAEVIRKIINDVFP